MAEEKTKKVETFKQRLARAQYQISKTELRKEGHNPFYNSTYSTLDNYNNAVQPALEKNQIYQTFKFCSMEGEGTILKLIVADALSDEIMESCLRLPEYKKDIHSFGSETTYSKRLLISAFYNLSTSENDDDGNSAMTNSPQKSTSVPSSSSKPTPTRREEGTQSPSNNLWWKKPEHNYLNVTVQVPCIEHEITKDQLFNRLKERYKTAWGDAIQELEDVHKMKKDAKEKLKADIEAKFMDIKKADESPTITEQETEIIEDDDIPF